MTPTEQEKELDEIVDKYIYDIAVLRPYTRVTKEAKRRLVKLITADRERVALGARLYDNERTLAHIQNGMPVERLKTIVKNRITELKAQQEKE